MKQLQFNNILSETQYARGCHIHTYCRAICDRGQTQSQRSRSPKTPVIGQTRNYTVKKQNENFNPQSNKTNLLKVYEFILDYMVFINTFRLALCMRLRLRDL